MTLPAKAIAFRLSRIYAQGWNAARTVWTTDSAPANPYVAEPERSRWQTGFSSAQTDSRRTSQ
jgi:ribosome modulation factor